MGDLLNGKIEFNSFGRSLILLSWLMVDKGDVPYQTTTTSHNRTKEHVHSYSIPRMCLRTIPADFGLANKAS
jgi:hypothetical protein